MTDEWKAPAKASAESGDEKSWKLLEKTLLASVQEQRRSRRWGIFFKLLTFFYLFGALALFSPMLDFQQTAARSAAHTALIDVRGVIADQESASADNVISSLRAAFKDPKTKGIILRIHSPGGSPVQSGYIYDEIRRLRAKHEAHQVVFSGLAAALAELHNMTPEQLDALRKDAARYRWIRTAGAWESECGMEVLSESPDKFDAAIDAARGQP